MKSKISYLILFFCFINVFSQKDIKIISSDDKSLTFEFNPILTDTSFITVNGFEYRKFNFYLGKYDEFMEGLPAVQKRWINIGVPAETGNSIKVLSYSYSELDGRIVPIPKSIEVQEQSEFVYEESTKYDQFNIEDIVEFGEYGISRGLKIQTIKIAPVHFNPVNNKIRFYNKIVVRIDFAESQAKNNTVGDEFLTGAVINYNTAKKWIAQQRELGKTTVTNSVLSTGKWYRFEAPEEGFYKITKAILSSYGIDPSTVDPRTIKIYNNGGTMVPETNSLPRVQDLVENAIYIAGESDGKFDDADYIILYGRGVHFWAFDTINNKFKRNRSYYSKENYYWITSGGTWGKRIQEKQGLNNSNPAVVSSTPAFVHWEEDKINVGSTGRQFLGDEFNSSTKSRVYTNSLEGLITSTPVYYHYRFVNASSDNAFFKLEENGTEINSHYIAGYGTYDYSYGIADSQTISYSGNIPNNRSLLKFNFIPYNSSSIGYLDYFEISYQRSLQYENNPFIFFSKNQNGLFEYQISNLPSSNVKVWDITNYSDVKLITSPTKQSGGEYYFQSSEIYGKPSKYYVMEGDNYKTPKNPVEVKNQNLHGITGGYKFIIITHKNFKDQAERLKSHKESQSVPAISTIVVDIEQIFNEFSCGMRDISAIRDFIKYAYFNWQVKPAYVLLFGDGDYDYKNIENNNKNFVIPYETEESLDEIYSYCTDDFFVSVDGNDLRVDLSIGRINVQTIDQARNAVDKIIDYELNSEKGLWQNLITLVADDSYTSRWGGEFEHTSQSEDLSKNHISASFDQQKIYLAAYPTVQTSMGRRKPGVNQAIIDAINNGTLILNFIGHGAPDLWTHEQVFVQSTTIPQLNNKNYFFLTAATCDFGYYDRANNYSSSEELILKSNSGAIGTFSATRPVYSINNALLNNFFYDQLLATPRDTMELMIPVGEALYLTKLDFYQVNDLKYNLLGDPTIRLKVPNYSAKIDSINGNSLVNDVQIKALSNVKIAGTVRKDNSWWNSFSGQGILTIYDSQRELPLPEFGPNYTMTLQGGIIFKGLVSVNNGIFSENFIVPKDISYENKRGKAVFFFYNNQNDGIGFSNKIIVGGTDTTLVDDKKGPSIEISFDNLEYENSYLVNPNSTFLAKLKDETGLNTTGVGVGHKMEGILDDDINNPIDFTNYFAGDLNSGGKSGVISYKLNNLSSGEHKITVKAWDVFNNPSSAYTDFKIVTGNGLIVDYVMNYPNPFTSATTFTFQHNFDGGINVKIRIYTVAGRLINEIEKRDIYNDRFVKIDWDGKDKDNNLLANGTYFYKLIVESINGNNKQTVLGKLAIIK